VPTANITVALNNTLVTSRIFNSGTGASEALLLIDEPGTTPITPSVGPALPQLLCTSATLGAGIGGCATIVGSITNSGGTATAAVLASAPTTVPNVFQGIVPTGSNQVIFNGIPILAPVTSGFARVFRITNIRANASQLGGGGQFQGTTSILAGITISNGLLVQSPVLTAANVFTGISTSVRNANNTGGGSSIAGSPLAQCTTNTSITGAAVLRYTEGFASAFKTRIAPTATLSGAATPANSIIPSGTFTQNVPGLVYGGSESGFIYPTPAGTAGLADFGTRLRATFNNIPTGMTIFVSTTNLSPSGPANNTTGGVTTVGTLSNLPLGNSNTLIAGLVIGETAGLQGVGGAQTGFLPLASASNNVGSVNMQVTALTADANGTATAVWEILNANPASQETAEFAVFYTVIGNQLAGTPQVTPAGTVSMGFAPQFATYNTSTAIPRFSLVSTSNPFVNVALCQTTLLFPFVNTTPGFDTGVAIANTSADAAGTKQQTGPCTLNFFGSGAGTTTTAPFPSAGGNIAPGTLNAEQVSNIRNGFSGYVIAVCNFQLAHGYALFSDTGIRNWATGYLALVLPGGSRSGFESLGN